MLPSSGVELQLNTEKHKESQYYQWTAYPPLHTSTHPLFAGLLPAAAFLVAVSYVGCNHILTVTFLTLCNTIGAISSSGVFINQMDIAPRWVFRRPCSQIQPFIRVRACMTYKPETREFIALFMKIDLKAQIYEEQYDDVVKSSSFGHKLLINWECCTYRMCSKCNITYYFMHFRLITYSLFPLFHCPAGTLDSFWESPIRSGPSLESWHLSSRDTSPRT